MLPTVYFSRSESANGGWWNTYFTFLLFARRWDHWEESWHHTHKDVLFLCPKHMLALQLTN